MASVAFAVGKMILKSPLDVDLSEPKARTTQEAFVAFALYIKAPLAVMVEFDHVVSAKLV